MPSSDTVRWLSIIGIGEDGVEGLSPRAAAAIAGAEIVFGGSRHLKLAASLINNEARAWPSPFSDGIAQVVAARGRRVCVLGSGDPMLHGVGATLSRTISAAEMMIIPGASAFSLAAALLGWPLAEVATLSLHNRPLALLKPVLVPGTRIMLLTSGADDPASIARLLTEAGFGRSTLTLLEALGGPRERIRSMPASRFIAADVDPLNVVAIECVADPGTCLPSLATGRDEDLFEHDGQISKREIRSVALGLLAPRRGELLWDVGGGAGSIAIEWMLSGPTLRAIAIEPRSDRAERIGRNAERFGVPNLTVVTGGAPEALADLPSPDAIYLGGGATAPGVFDTVVAAISPGARLVASAVTLETEALLLDAHARLGGGLVRIGVDRASPVGRMTGWRPAIPVILWHWTRP